jgi:hypothetical protein
VVTHICNLNYVEEHHGLRSAIGKKLVRSNKKITKKKSWRRGSSGKNLPSKLEALNSNLSAHTHTHTHTHKKAT